jgi:hypothetical protein
MDWSLGTGGRSFWVGALVGMSAWVKQRSVGYIFLPHPGVRVTPVGCGALDWVEIGGCLDMSTCVGMIGVVVGGRCRAVRISGLWSSCEWPNIEDIEWICRDEWLT